MDLVTSMKALNKTVEASQLTSDLGGSFTYSHADWLQFHQVPVFPPAAIEAQFAWGFPADSYRSPVHPLVNFSSHPKQTLVTAFFAHSVWFVCGAKGGCVHRGKVLCERFRLSKSVCQHKRMRMTRMHFINVLKIINSLFNCLEFLHVCKFRVIF